MASTAGSWGELIAIDRELAMPKLQTPFENALLRLQR